MITIHHDVQVQLIDARATDQSVVDAARVSVIGDETLTREPDAKADAGLIGYLMKNCRVDYRRMRRSMKLMAMIG